MIYHTTFKKCKFSLLLTLFLSFNIQANPFVEIREKLIVSYLEILGLGGPKTANPLYRLPSKIHRLTDKHREEEIAKLNKFSRLNHLGIYAEKNDNSLKAAEEADAIVHSINSNKYDLETRQVIELKSLINMFNKGFGRARQINPITLRGN